MTQRHIPPNTWSRTKHTLAPAGPTEMLLCRYPGVNSPLYSKLISAHLVTNHASVARLVREFDLLKPFAMA